MSIVLLCNCTRSGEPSELAAAAAITQASSPTHTLFAFIPILQARCNSPTESFRAHSTARVSSEYVDTVLSWASAARDDNDIFLVLYVHRNLRPSKSILCSTFKIGYLRITHPEDFSKALLIMALTDLHTCNVQRTLIRPSRIHFLAFRAASMPTKGTKGAQGISSQH